MELAGDYTKDPTITKYNLCMKFHCLPSQLEKEDAKLIEMFIIIGNEYIAKEESAQREAEAEARLRGMM